MRLLIMTTVLLVSMPVWAQKQDPFTGTATTPLAPLTGGPVSSLQATATDEGRAMEEADAKPAVERAVGRDVSKYYFDWKMKGGLSFPRFVDYMYYRYDRDRRRGIVLAGAVGGSFIIVGAGAFIPMIVLAFNCSGYYYNNYDYGSCVDEELLIPGAALLGTLGSAGIAAVIAGAIKAYRSKRRMSQVAALRSAKVARPAVAFSGFSPLADSRQALRGLSLNWEF